MRDRALQKIPWGPPVHRWGSTGIGAVFLAVISAGVGCGDDAVVTPPTPHDDITCGPGTQIQNKTCVANQVTPIMCGAGSMLMNGVCVVMPVPPGPTCGAGTMLENGECVPTPIPPDPKFEPGHFGNPIVQLQNLEDVGSHTDEVRLHGDLLINCSYTFNIIDAADARDMQILSEGNRPVIPGDTRRPGCKHMAFDDNLVFITHLGNIRNPAYLSGYDITDPEAPVQLSVLQETDISYEGIGVSNHNIFVARHENGLGIYTYNTSTITPGFTNIGNLGGFTNAWGLAVRDDTVFIADGPDGLVTVDVTNPAVPVELGRLPLNGFGRFLVIDGNYAYVALGSGGVAVVDISNLATPTLVSTIDMPGTAVRVDFSDGRVFVAAWNDVRVYDVTTPASPRFIASVRIPRAYDYDDPNRERPTMRIFGVAARGLDVFIGTWENPYSYRLQPDVLAPNIRLPETAARIDFGVVEVGATSVIPYEVTNQGSAPLTIVDSWISNPAFTVEPHQAIVQPGETLIMELSYTANATTATAEGYFHIFSDDPAYPLRKPFVIANGEGAILGSPLPVTNATLLDGTPWVSTETTGSVVLITYFGTF